MTEDDDSSKPVVVGIGNFDYSGGFRFGSTTLKRYRGDYPQEFELLPGDLLLAMTCQTADGEILGIPGRIPHDGTTYLHNQRLGKVEVLDPSRFDLGFAFQLARWKTFNRHLFVTSSGSKILHTSPGRIEEFAFDLPPLEEQRGIASTLGSLDDQIDLNRRIVVLIPQLIRSVVAESLLADSLDLAVADLGVFINGGAFTKDASGTGRIVIRIAELNSGPGPSTIYSDRDVSEDRKAQPGEILMSWSGSLGVYRWFRDEAIVNQHIFKVIPAAGLPAWLVFDRLEAVMPIFQAIAKDKATTMGHIQRWHLQATRVEVPNVEAIKALDHSLSALWERLLLAEREIVRLAQLRDALLPELFSGRIRVAEANEAIAGIVA